MVCCKDMLLVNIAYAYTLHEGWCSTVRLAGEMVCGLVVYEAMSWKQTEVRCVIKSMQVQDKEINDGKFAM